MYDDPQDIPNKEHHREVLRWANAAVEEGEAFLRSCSGYDSISTVQDAIMSEWTGEVRPASLSNLYLNQFAKIATDTVAAETDIKPFWDFKTKNVKFQPQAEMGQKLAESWWLRRHVAMKFADVLKLANIAGTGYAHQVWNSTQQDLDLIAEDCRDVIPIRPGSLHSIQDAFGMMLRRERTVNWIKAKYPSMAAYIRPDRDASYAKGGRASRTSALIASMGLKSTFMENLWATLGGRPASQQLNVPTADLFTCYVTDTSTNKTGASVWMGLLDGRQTNWSYEVKPGEPLYPRKRLLVFTRTALLYDDTSIYWHGLFPVCKLTLDPWPGTWLGKAPFRDLLPLYSELNKLMRIVSQHHSRIERPGLAADKNSISRAAMDRIDTARAGIKLRHNPLAGKGIELLHEPPLDPSVKETVEFLINQMKELSGARDMTQLMNLGQIPAAETVEHIMETMSPAIRLRSQVIECFMGEFAMMTLMNFFQFYTLPQRISILGPKGMTFEDFDYDPETMIPDMMDMGLQTAEGKPLPRYDRAKEFLRYFTYEVAPGSLLAASGITQKLMYIQLFRMGVIDAVTLLENLDVPNIGAEDWPNTIVARMQKQAELGFQGTVSAAGRKSSGQQAPRMKISESG